MTSVARPRGGHGKRRHPTVRKPLTRPYPKRKPTPPSVVHNAKGNQIHTNKPRYLPGTGKIPGKVKSLVRPYPKQKKRHHVSTYYATSPTGETHKIRGTISLQARQQFASQGINISSRPPGQSAQQNLSNRYGITTFTQWGDVSTQPQSGNIKREQQRLSDTYGVTTYNPDGTVSTSPNVGNMGVRLEKASKKPWVLPF